MRLDHIEAIIYKIIKSIERLMCSLYELNTIYYQETDQVDFFIYKFESWREEIWEALKAAKNYDVENLLTSEELLQWRDRTFNFFNDPSKEPGLI